MDTQAEEVSALKQEIADLKRQLADAKFGAGADDGGGGDALFQRLWEHLHENAEEIFPADHAPDAKTFENICTVFGEMLRTYSILEHNVHHMLRDLRQVGEKGDRLGQFYIMLTKNPGLGDTIREFVTTGKKKNNFLQLLRALQAWVRAFASGPFKVIIKSPNLIGPELNYKSWELKTGFAKGEDAAIGEYFKSTLQKSLPEKLGTLFRKEAGRMAYEDYNELMKSAKRK